VNHLLRISTVSMFGLAACSVIGCATAPPLPAATTAPAANEQDLPRGPAYVPPPQPQATQTTLYAGGSVLPTPTPQQATWEDDELGMFFHFDIEVFDKEYLQQAAKEDQLPEGTPRVRAQRGERGTPLGMMDPAEFNPTNLDTDQWMRVAQSIGAKYAVFTTKHSSGFLMWQSDLYPFGVKQSPWQNGKGDVVLDYLASCRKFGISPGLYCSAGGHSYWTTHHPKTWYRKGILFGQPQDVRDFLDMDLKMYADLWQHAGPVDYMWFDGGVNPLGPDLSPIIARLEPNMVCFNGPMEGAPAGLARWSGNEKGYANYPTWNAIDTTNDQHDRGPGSPDGKYWIPVEANVPLRYHVWMWQSDTENKILSLNALATDYLDSVGRGTNFIINANIGPDGLVPQADAARFAEFGDLLHKWFDHPIAQTRGRGDTAELAFSSPTPVDCISIVEDIRLGQRVQQYVVEALVDGQWKQVCDGTSIGHKRIQFFDRLTATALRVRATASAAQPVWRQLAVYNIDPLPPDPTNPATTAQSAQ
jgi:alpha-L-fucosidase